MVIGRKSYGFQKILCFKNQPSNRLYPKKAKNYPKNALPEKALPEKLKKVAM